MVLRCSALNFRGHGVRTTFMNEVEMNVRKCTLASRPALLYGLIFMQVAFSCVVLDRKLASACESLNRCSNFEWSEFCSARKHNLL